MGMSSSSFILSSLSSILNFTEPSQLKNQKFRLQLPGFEDTKNDAKWNMYFFPASTIFRRVRYLFMKITGSFCSSPSRRVASCKSFQMMADEKDVKTKGCIAQLQYIPLIYHLYTTYCPCQWGDYMLPIPTIFEQWIIMSLSKRKMTSRLRIFSHLVTRVFHGNTPRPMPFQPS